MERNAKSLWLLFAQTVAVLTAATLVWQTFWRVPVASYADKLSRALPSVVGIYGRHHADLPSSGTSVGAGVIVGAEHVLTNYHLIANMAVVEVDVNGDKRMAEVVGLAPEIDIALLRAPGAKQLPVIEFADDSNLQQGDVVFAIGNPFGLNRSVSMGIISAVGRSQLGLINQEDFIQTDAAINPGSSGGALINASGELIGISSALFARHPEATPQGIGFAVRANVVRRSLQDFLPQSKTPADNPLGAELRPLSERLQEDILDFTPASQPVMLVSKGVKLLR